MTKRLSTLLAVLMLLASCAPAPAPVQAWKTLDGVAVTVDTAMKAAGDLYRAGRINDAQRDDIIRVYDCYRQVASAANAAIKAWHALDPKAKTTPPHIGDALRKLNAAAGDVLSTAKSHGVK